MRNKGTRQRRTTSYIPSTHLESSKLLPIQTDCFIYHAYASGASPPGPGQISSIFLSSSFLKRIFSARNEPVNCSIVRGPMIGAVTAGWFKTQASATSAGFSPSPCRKLPIFRACRASHRFPFSYCPRRGGLFRSSPARHPAIRPKADSRE